MIKGNTQYRFNKDLVLTVPFINMKRVHLYMRVLIFLENTRKFQRVEECKVCKLSSNASEMIKRTHTCVNARTWVHKETVTKQGNAETSEP